ATSLRSERLWTISLTAWCAAREMSSYLDCRLVSIATLERMLRRVGCSTERNATGALRVRCRCGSKLAVLQTADRDVAESTARFIARGLGCSCVRERRRANAANRVGLS